VVDEFEPLQQHSQDERGLLESELPTDAGPHSGPEGAISIGRHGLEALGAEMVRVELLGVGSPHTSVPVQHRHEDR